MAIEKMYKNCKECNGEGWINKGIVGGFIKQDRCGVCGGTGIILVDKGLPIKDGPLAELDGDEIHIQLFQLLGTMTLEQRVKLAEVLLSDKEVKAKLNITSIALH